jgi:hypothetical protein
MVNPVCKLPGSNWLRPSLGRRSAALLAAIATATGGHGEGAEQKDHHQHSEKLLHGETHPFAIGNKETPDIPNDPGPLVKRLWFGSGNSRIN